MAYAKYHFGNVGFEPDLLSKLLNRFILFFFGLLYSVQVNAQYLPEWELGLAVGFAKLPYYRGASSGRDIILPLPLGIFRGKKYRVDDDGGRRWLFRSLHVTLDLGVSASLPVPDGGKAAAREGMPGLDAIIELGPRINIRLWKQKRHQVSAVFPFRFASSLSFSRIAYRGWVFAPNIAYTYENKGRNGWKFKTLAGLLYAADKYHDYFYSVNQEYVTENRAFYDAGQGYSGSRFLAYLQKRYGRLWLSIFARYDVLSGAIFEESPLVEQSNYAFGGFVVGWIFKKSPVRVYEEG